MNYINIIIYVCLTAICTALAYVIRKKQDIKINKALFTVLLTVLQAVIYLYVYLRDTAVYFAALYGIILFIMYMLCVWDIKEKQIPVYLVYVLFFACSIMMLINPYCKIVNNVITGGIVALVLFAVYKIGRAGIGLGDVEVIAALAFAFGYPHAFSIFVMALLMSMIAGISLIITKKAGIKSEIAFIPFLFAGYILNILNF